MDNKNFNSSSLNELSIYELRNLGRQMGVYSPTIYKKQELINQIVLIVNGDAEPYIRKNKQGRPPKSLIDANKILEVLVRKDINLNTELEYNSNLEYKRHNVANKNSNFDHISKKDNSNDDNMETVSGIVEIYNNNFGFLHNDFMKTLSNGIYISNKHIEEYHLKSGDVVTAKINSGLKEISNAVCEVLTVNGKPPLTDIRINFEDMNAIYPGAKIKLETEEQITGKVIDLFTPICFGQRVLVSSSEQLGSYDILGSIANLVEKNNKKAKVIYFAVDNAPEYIAELKKNTHIEVFALEFSLSFEVRIRTANLVLEYVKRQVENGEQVILFIDGVEKMIEAYANFYSSTDETNVQSGNMTSYNVSANSFIKSVYSLKRMFATGRNTKEGGSVTIFASLLTDESVNEDKTIRKELKSIANALLVLSKNMQYIKLIPPINIMESYSESLERCISSRHIECVQSIREKCTEQNYIEYIKTVFANLLNCKTTEEFCQKY